MAWQKMQFRLTGDAPMIQHNGQTADPLNRFSKAMKAISGKRKKTDSDLEELARLEFLAGLYMSETGPMIPAMVLDACVIDAAKKSREGVLAKSGFFTVGNAPLEYDGPRTTDELWQDERFRLSVPVRVQQARVVRTRPIFNEWALTCTVQYEDTVVNAATVAGWFSVAGTLVGLGDWRPRYGRFQAQRL